MFEWDANKARSNRKKHGLSFGEAVSDFSHPLARIFRTNIIPASTRRPAEECPMTISRRPRTKTKRDTGLRSEYRFDYAKAAPNRFAGRKSPGAIAVLLDPDVASV